MGGFTRERGFDGGDRGSWSDGQTPGAVKMSTAEERGTLVCVWSLGQCCKSCHSNNHRGRRRGNYFNQWWRQTWWLMLHFNTCPLAKHFHFKKFQTRIFAKETHFDSFETLSLLFKFFIFKQFQCIDFNLLPISLVDIYTSYIWEAFAHKLQCHWLLKHRSYREEEDELLTRY